jgi:excisionase family DNA binding protein
VTTVLLRTTDAANYLGVSKAFLERDRWAGPQIPFVRIGNRAVRYRLADLENYIAGKRQESANGR